MNVVIQAAYGTAAIWAQYQSKRKMKIKLQCGEKVIYHDIKDKLVVPLTFGSGVYSFILYEQSAGNKYHQKSICKKKVVLDANAYTYSANSYVNFDQTSKFYTLARELNNFDNIYDYLVNHFSYDYIEAIVSAKQAFTIINLNDVFTKKRGVCYSLSALFAAMLRICKIPTKLVIGTANYNPHAWIETNGKIYDLANILAGENTDINYKSERFY